MTECRNGQCHKVADRVSVKTPINFPSDDFLKRMHDIEAPLRGTRGLCASRLFKFPLASCHHHHLPRPPAANPLYDEIDLGTSFITMDKSLDEVRRVFARHYPRLTVATQIIATTRPKGIRKSNPRRNSGKAQVLGTANSAPAARARAVPASNGAKTVPAPTSQQPADKIIVSNLPIDVNELQVRVSLPHMYVYPCISDCHCHYRSSSTQQWARSRT